MATRKKSDAKSLSLSGPLQLIALPASVVEVGLIYAARNAAGTNLTILIVGMLVILIFVVTAGYLLARTPSTARESSPTPDATTDNRRIRPEGTYLAEGNRNYRVEIRHVGENVYEVTNPDWRGTGLMVGLQYYGIFIYDDQAKYTPGLAGAHIARFDPEKRTFEGRRLEFRDNLQWHRHLWTPA